MDRVQKAIATSLIITSAIAWVASIQQPDMMAAATSYKAVTISLFTANWTAGMAAMMFPAITPMVVLYHSFVANTEKQGGKVGITIQKENGSKSSPIRLFRVMLFVSSYLIVWAITGIALLLGWSIVMNNIVMTTGNARFLPSIFGTILIIAGAYQFTPLKRMCIGICESPMSFFMRRWKDGTYGAVRMGVWHGMYCLGCCWAYFLLMVALGWMNLLWMGVFVGIIFGEKMRKGGIWVARSAGVGLIVAGVLVIIGMLPKLVSSAASMGNSNTVMEMGNEGGSRNDMTGENGTEKSMDMTSDNHNSADFSETVGIIIER